MKENEKYKQSADLKRRRVEFKEGDLVYAVLMKDRFPIGAYNKLKARKIGPVEILKKINDNVYQLKLLNDVYTSDVFNVKHLIPYYEEEQSSREDHLNSRTNSFQPGEDDAAYLISGLRSCIPISRSAISCTTLSRRSVNDLSSTISRTTLSRRSVNDLIKSLPHPSIGKLRSCERPNPRSLNPSVKKLRSRDDLIPLCREPSSPSPRS